MMKKIKPFLTSLALFALPVVVAAQDPGDNFDDFLSNVEGWINTLIPIVIGIALLFFLWGLAKYMLAAGDEEQQSEGRRLMVTGVIVLFVMVAVWGLVNFLVDTFGFTDESAPLAPEAPSSP